MAVRTSNTITFTEQKKILQIKEWYIATNYNKIILSQDAPQVSYVIDETVTSSTIGIYYTIVDGEYVSKILPDEYDATLIYYRVENLWLDENTGELKEFVKNNWALYSAQFQDTVQQADSINRYLWNYEEVIYSIGKSEKSMPVIVGTYGSVQDIINYYAVTTQPLAPIIDAEFNGWDSDFSNIQLSNINKYLWNFEIIIYADGTTKQTSPAIIGVYGDSGEDAISFKIYSTNGLEFVDSINEDEKIETIDLRLSVYKGSKPLTEDVKFTWYWHDPETTDIDSSLIDEEGYQVIEGYEGITNPTFSVNINDKYAFANLKCKMLYKNEKYTDYVTLKMKQDAYSAGIKFFNGTNVFSQGQQYIVGYIELYKNNKVEETTAAATYYSSIVALDDKTGIIRDYVVDGSVSGTTEGIYYIIENGKYVSKNLPEEFDEEQQYYTINPLVIEETLSYFICNDNNEYKVVLGFYDSDQNDWIDVKHIEDLNELLPRYVYSNDGNTCMDLNVFVVLKEEIIRTKNIDIDVFTRSLEYDSYVIDSSVTSDTIGEYWILDSEDNQSYISVILPDQYSENQEYYKLIHVKSPDEEAFIATTTATIIDLNDTTVSAIPPENPQDGQLWLDTENNVLKIYNGKDGEWRLSAKQQEGQSIFVTKPDSYNAGDLWIVEEPGYYFLDDTVTSGTQGDYWVKNINDDDSYVYIRKVLPEQYIAGTEYYLAFQAGSLFRAKQESNEFNIEHWEDAMQSVTQIINNVTQYMVFNPSSGLKIGQADDNLFVNISSTEMGFYDNTNKNEEAVKVVSIGNQAANIRNATIESSANFQCPIVFSDDNNMSEYINLSGRFIFQIEKNGSLSLVVG